MLFSLGCELNNHLKLFDLNTYKVNQNIQEILSNIFNNFFSEMDKDKWSKRFLKVEFFYIY